MGFRHQLTVGLALAATLLGSSACKREPPPAEAPPAPVDRLASDEQVLSREKAFALPLPRSARVRRGFGATYYVSTDLTPEELSNFVHKYVKGGNVTAGSGGTVFASVVVPAEPIRKLDIAVRPGKPLMHTRSEMTVTDVTPLPDTATSDEERWRKAGLNPDGTPIDRQHME